MSSRELLTTDEVAELIRVDISTLKRWRAAGKGPSYIRIGEDKILYRRATIETWLDERTVRTTTKGE